MASVTPASVTPARRIATGKKMLKREL